MKNKKILNLLNITLFIFNIVIMIGLIIVENSHVCYFNVAALSKCPIFLTKTISILHNIFNYVFHIILLVNIVLSIIVFIKKGNIKNKVIHIIIFTISIFILLLRIYITISNYRQPLVVDKPIIYIYPDKNINLKVKVGNDKILTSTYPKYNNEWNLNVSVGGNIYDYKTKRNYYALYWEAIDNTKINEHEGFIVSGKDTVTFLEEKLEYLGLNEREIEEFIVYWLPKLENNKYNYIRFRTQEEINEYMPLYFSEKPDTIIRVIMDFKPLNKKRSIKTQQLKKQNRNGFTVVEWGARKLVD